MNIRIVPALAAALTLFQAAYAQTDATQAAKQAAQAIADAPKINAPTPEPEHWEKTLATNLSFAQTSYTNWAKGGNSNVAMNAYVDANANYAKDLLSWKNRLQLDYGFLYSEDIPILQKSKDRMLLESTLGYKATDKINYAAKFTFLNQFANGYTYGTPSGEDPTREDWLNARTLKSGFLSPGIVTLGLGIDWIPNAWLTVNFSPVTGGFTIVRIEELRPNYTMPLKSEYKDYAEDDLLPSYYKSARFEFGCQLTATAKMKVNDNFEASTQVILFSNYLKNPQNIRVNWDNTLSWKLAKYFALTFTTNLIYDDTVRIVDDKYPDGHRAVQFLEAFQFGFTYTFTSKKG